MKQYYKTICRTVFFVFLIIFVSPVFAGEDWISFSGAGKVSNPSVVCSKSGFEQIVLNIQVPGLLSKDVNIKGLNFNELTIPGEGYSIETGKPKIPVIRKFVEIPFEANYSLGIVSNPPIYKKYGTGKLQNTLIPVQPSVPKLPGAKEAAKFVKDQETYDKDSIQYSKLAEVVYEGIWRGKRVILVEVRPIDYNPVKNVLSIREKIEVTINLDGGNQNLTDFKKARYSTKPFNEIAEKTIINSKTSSGGSEIPGYLIITSDAFLEGGHLDRWAEWKFAQGMDVKIASTDQIGEGLKAISQYIQDAYDTWPIPPTFVLLVGDVDTIPAFTGFGEDNPTTDLYYSTVDGDDYMPDLWLGRISVTNPNQLGSVVDKLLEYQQGTWTAEYPWIKRATFLASEDNYDVSEGTHNYVVDSYLDPLGYTVNKLYSHTYDAVTGQVYKAINEGCSLLVYSGHGGPSGWGDGPPFNSDDVRQLENEVFPMVWSFACSTNPYDYDECFGEVWLRHIPGAAGFIGSSVSSLWDEDDILERALFDAFYRDNITWAQGMNNFGKSEVVRFYGGLENSQMYVEMYNYMGDPSTDIWTSTPEVVVASHSPTCIKGVLHYPVEVEQDLVNVAAIFGDQVLGVGKSSGGRALVKFDTPISVTGNITLSYTGHNVLPASDTITLETPVGSYLVYRSHRLDDLTGGDGDGIPEVGEYINLWLTVANVGDSNSDSAVGKLLGTLDSYVGDSENEVSIGSIISGGTAELAEPFVIWIPYDCPNEHIVRMQMSIESSKTQWIDELEFQVTSAPQIGVNPESVSTTLLPDSTSTDTIKVSNLGTDELNFKVKLNIGGEGCCDSDKAIDYCSPNYSWIDSLTSGGPQYNWIEISEIGTLIHGTGDDETFGPFDIGFNFPFFTETFSQFNICTNGFISFTDTSSAYENSKLPSANAPRAMIAPYWDDLQLEVSSLYYYNDGSKLIIQFDKVPRRSGVGTYTFEIILEPDGTIYYQYKEIKGEATSGTIGLQNHERDQGVTVSMDEAYVQSEMAIEFAVPVYWLHMEDDYKSSIPPLLGIGVISAEENYVTFDVPSVSSESLVGDSLIIQDKSFEIISNTEHQITVDSRGEDISSYGIVGTTISVARHEDINLEFSSVEVPVGTECGAVLYIDSNDDVHSTIPVYIDYFVNDSGNTPTPTNTETPFITPTITWTPDIPTPSGTPTPNDTYTPTSTPDESETPTPTGFMTEVPTSTETPVGSETPTPTPTLSADFNSSGIVDTTDAFTFAKNWFGGDMSMDLSGDGTIDPGDINLFIKQWHLRNDKRLEVKHSDCLPGTRDESDSKQTSDATGEVTLSVDGNALKLFHHNVRYNCCIEDIKVTCRISSGTIKFDEWEDFGESGPCYCLCLYDVEATQYGVESGTYNVEIWIHYDGGAGNLLAYTGTIQVP